MRCLWFAVQKSRTPSSLRSLRFMVALHLPASTLNFESQLQKQSVASLDCLCEVLWGSVVSSAKPFGASRSQSRDQRLCDCLWVSILTVGVDLPRAWRLSGGFTFAGLSQLHNEHCWLGKRVSEGVGAVVHALVSVSSRRLLEYKWDVLIHLNQGHMFRPTVKCSELNEALCCICHSPRDIKLGTHSALCRKHSVTFKESVVIDLIIHIYVFDIFLCAACKPCHIYSQLILIRLSSNPAIISS